MKLIQLRLIGDSWYATWCGEDREKMIRIFETATIPTPFRAATDLHEMIKIIAERNPGYNVEILK